MYNLGAFHDLEFERSELSQLRGLQGPVMHLLIRFQHNHLFKGTRPHDFSEGVDRTAPKFGEYISQPSAITEFKNISYCSVFRNESGSKAS